MNRKQIQRIKSKIREIASQIHRDLLIKGAKHGKKMRHPNHKREVYHYQCNGCGGWFLPHEIEVDHIREVGSFVVVGPKSHTRYGDCSIENLDIWFKRLFCDVENLQRLCERCHSKKTADYNKDTHKHRESVVKYYESGGDLL